MANQKNFKGRKPKKPYPARDRKMGDFKEDRKDSCNDPSWYVKEGQLAKDIASLSFNTSLGARTEINVDNNGGDWSQSALSYGVPGILSLNFIPSVGVSEGGYSPINIAAKNLYSFVRHANSGSKNYDSPDLILYVVAMDSIYMAIQHLQRAYGTARVYSQLNRYVGDAFLKAQGFDPNDVRANLAQFRAQINMLIVKASVFAVPSVMSLFQRHAWMVRGVFQDAPVDKCQTYMYRPVGMYKYIETSGGPGYCELKPCAVDVSTQDAHEYIYDIQWTTAQWFSYVNDLISALVASEDIAIMSGDLLKAFGSENMFKLGLIPEDYSLEVNFSEEILDQIHNTIFCGAMPRTFLDRTNANQVQKVDWTGFQIAQDANIGDGALYYKPQFARIRDIGIQHVLDMYDKEPTPERVLVATRNMSAGDVYTNGVDNYTVATLRTCGSDICLYAMLWDYNTDMSGNWILRWRQIMRADGTLGFELYSDPGDYSAFHRAPLMYVYTDVYTGKLENTFGEIDNYTLIDRATLAKIHESAIMSMLNVPV